MISYECFTAWPYQPIRDKLAPLGLGPGFELPGRVVVDPGLHVRDKAQIELIIVHKVDDVRYASEAL